MVAKRKLILTLEVDPDRFDQDVEVENLILRYVDPKGKTTRSKEVPFKVIRAQIR